MVLRVKKEGLRSFLKVFQNLVQACGPGEQIQETPEAALELFARCASKGLSSQREAMAMKAMAIQKACRLHLDSCILEASHISEALYRPALRHSSVVSNAPIKK